MPIKVLPIPRKIVVKSVPKYKPSNTPTIFNRPSPIKKVPAIPIRRKPLLGEGNINIVIII